MKSLHVGLVIDHSGSMREKLADVTTGAQAFVHSSNPHDQMFVVNFNETVSLGLPIGISFSDNAEQLGGAIWGAPAMGTTALYYAIIEALKRLQQGTSDKKVLIAISDGGENARKAGLDQVLKMAQQSSAMIYTIGIFEPDDPDQNPKVLQRLAQETGGEAMFPTRLSETVEICEHIARDIRDQYTIGYSSPNTSRDGTYHKVRLAARMNGNGKLSVRTRAGYRARGALQPSREGFFRHTQVVGRVSDGVGWRPANVLDPGRLQRTRSFLADLICGFCELALDPALVREPSSLLGPAS